MTVGVLGSGFGLYGYVPALIELGEHVVLPLRYRGELCARQDVCRLEHQIEWAADDATVIARSSSLVIVRRPVDQAEIVFRALNEKMADSFLLEKPLAPTPLEAEALLRRLKAEEKRVRIGYTFRFASWASDLKRSVSEGSHGELRIVWLFRAHHYANQIETWKRRPSQGGGALRFFGIHLIALLSELGYSKVLHSRTHGRGDDDAVDWSAGFSGTGLPPCFVLVDTDRSEPTFDISRDSRTGSFALHLRDPFDSVPVNGMFDRRVELLTHLCRSLLYDPDSCPLYYASSIQLWRDVEICTEHEPQHVLKR